MAIKIGKKSEEVVFKNYIGLASLNVLAVNPDAKTLGEIQGRDVTDEPVYVSKTDEGIDMVRINFLTKTDPSASINNGIEAGFTVSFMLTKQPWVGQASGSTQIIDKYGRTAWANPSVLAAKGIPVYSNGPAKISADYRVAYKGEENLINFLKAWLNIAPTDVWNNETKSFETKSDLSECEVSIDMEKLFKGDVSELQGLVDIAKPYAVKAAVGLRTVETDKGTKQYPQIYNSVFVKNGSNYYKELERSITESQAAGSNANTEFSFENLHEVVVEETNFNPLTDSAASEDKPW